MNYFHFEVAMLAIVFLVTSFVINCDASHHYFFSERSLPDGVHERLLFLKGIRAVQTVAGPREGSPSGIVLRQLSNKRQVLSLIYNGVPSDLLEVEGTLGRIDLSPIGPDEDGLQLRECKLERKREEVKIFEESFNEKSLSFQHYSLNGTGSTGPSNGTFVLLTNGHEETIIPFSYKPMIKYKELKQQCFRLNRNIRKTAKADRRQRELQFHQHNDSSSLISRPRRAVTSFLSIPNTKWCGQGYSARSYNDLGGLFGADGCCRQHDMHCPFFIRSFERKYGYFHFGLGTISHCSCDRRFKTCLKQTGTGASDVVGNVFFKIVKSNCFDFERKKVCKKRGFWSCVKWGYEKQAVIRSPILWN